MRTALDLLAGLILLLASPVWVVHMARRGTLRTDWPGRLGFGPTPPRKQAPRVLVHAGSVGEVAAAWPLIERLRQPADTAAEGGSGGGSGRGAVAASMSPLDVVLSVTTNTGIARAGQLAGGAIPVVRTPFAFHRAMRRWLRRCDPDVIVLMELEVWPPMVVEAARRGVPVMVVNGRLTERSLRRYRQVRSLIAPAFGRLAACAVQDDATGERFAAVGAPRDRITVTGTMKWDRAEIVDDVPGAAELAAAMGIDRQRPLVVAGSTSPDETTLIDAAIGDAAQLLIAPRRPEWFDGTADALPGSTRRTGAETGGGPRGRFVLDTIGELRPAYALADVVIVGRTFGTLHGSDMMEPVGLGKPVIVGPRTDDFAVVTGDLLAGGGLLQVTAEDLPATVQRLLSDPAERAALADRGRAVIRDRRGAATRNAAIVRSLLAANARAEGR